MIFTEALSSTIYSAHQLWLTDKKVGVRANLGEADLRGADLREADLREADLWGADLWGADLWRANLWRANLGEANLREANLWRANLGEANLREADLGEANLGGLTVLQIGPIGSRKDYLVYKYGENIDEVQAGCWRGTLNEFQKRVKEVHANNSQGKIYQIFVEALNQVTLAIKAENEKTALKEG